MLVDIQPSTCRASNLRLSSSSLGSDPLLTRICATVPNMSANSGHDSHFVQASGANVIDETAHALLVWNEGARLDAGDRLPHIFVKVGKRFEREGRPDPDLGLDLAFDVIVSEGEHAAVGVVNQDDLVGAQKPLRDNQRADGVVGSNPSSIADDMGLALLKRPSVVLIVSNQFVGNAHR